MLVLSRQRDESFEIHLLPSMIPPEGIIITLKCIDIRGDKVRTGIEAPPNIPIWRSEVAAAKRRQLEREGIDQSNAQPVL